MAFQAPPGLMVSVSGVRGRVGEALTPDVVTRFSAAFGLYLRESVGGRPTVVLARDSRTSGPVFSRAAEAALRGVGADVVYVGLVPTPTALLAIRALGADGGVIITASHNPVEWNALKLASASGMFLDAEEGARMRAYLEDESVAWAGWDGLGATRADDGAVERHIEAVTALPYVDMDGLRERSFTVALDTCSGAGAVLLVPLLEALGCRLTGINLEPDGLFPRAPEPSSENLGALKALVGESGADLGMATDPDGDRLALVDGTGRAIGEDYTLAFAAQLVLRHRQGPVVANLSTSRIVEDAARGQPFHRAPVGEINVARCMQAENAVVGGEGNGGVMLPNIHLTRDAAVAATLVLQLLLETGEPLAALADALGPYHIVKGSVPRPDRELGPVLDRLAADLTATVVDRRDGLWLGWPDDGRWLHVRPSGTEPVVRIIAEAPEADTAALLVDRVRKNLDGE